MAPSIYDKLLILQRLSVKRGPQPAMLHAMESAMRLFARISSVLLCLFLASASMSVSAQARERPFPLIAKRGTLSMTNYPTVMIDGTARKLSPGAWIKNANNTIDTPISLQGREYIVNYTENNEGDVDRVWILTDHEISLPPPGRTQ
jgi:hypothetical protein